VLVWDIDRPTEPPRRLEGGSQSVRAVSFNPDGDLLAVGGRKERLSTQRPCASGGLVLLWSWQEENQQPRRLCCAADDINEAVYSLAFNPSGTILAVGTAEGTNRRWDIAGSESEVAPLDWHSKSVRALLFPNDDTLISVRNDSNVLKWNLNDPGNPEVIANPNVPQSASLSPDGLWVALGSAYEGRIQIASVESESLVDLVCPQVGRNLTQVEWDNFIGKDVDYEKTCQEFPPG